MKSFIILFSSVCILIACFALRNRQSSLEVVLNQYNTNFRLFQSEVVLLQKKINAGKPKDELQLQFLKIRLAYKQCEWLMEYLEPGVKDINSPDLIKVDQAQGVYATLTPHGLQVMERLLNEDSFSRAEFDQETILLNKQIVQFQIRYPTEQIKDWQILDANRLAILRVGFLGSTSFDTPIVRQGSEESKVAWKTLKFVASAYLPFFEKYAPQQSRELNSFLKADDNTFFNNSTDSFDHFNFIKQRVLPFYRLMGDAHIASGLEYPGESGILFRAVNFHSGSVFGNDFINPWFFSDQKNDWRDSIKEKLGKNLFYDPVLSAGKNMSCSSCHRPEKAFSDGLKTSISSEGIPLARNAPGLMNTSLQNAYFHDMRASALENQIQHVVRNPAEFNSHYGLITERLRADSSYVKLFLKAFPNEVNPISEFTLNKSIAAYLRTFISHDAIFDQMIRGDIAPDQSVVQGFNLFMGKAKCGTCHFPPEFSGLVPPFYSEIESEVLGVPANPDLYHPIMDSDGGRDTRIQSVWYRAFKTPGLRNAALTAPYMHNGVFADLSQVLEFYNKGGGNGLNLEIPNQTLSSDSLALSSHEKFLIEQFINSLTDSTFIKKSTY